jgi:hypothetical protein
MNVLTLAKTIPPATSNQQPATETHIPHARTFLPWIKVKQEDIIDTVPIPDIHTETPEPMHQ